MNEQSLANVLSFDAVASKLRITIDTELDLFINVNLHDVTRIIFKKCWAGLPSETIILSKISNPMIQEKSSGHTQMVDNKNMTTPRL